MFIKGFTFVFWKSPGGVKVNAVIRGLVWALGCVFCLCFALGIWVVLSPAALRYFSTLLGAAVLPGVFLGGLGAGLAARNAGWFHGGLVGFCCGMIFLLPVLAGGGGFWAGTDLAARLGICTLDGLAGGVVGVNLPAAVSGRRYPVDIARIFLSARKRGGVGGTG